VADRDEVHHATAARAAVLARLWGAFAREPLPGIRDRTAAGDTLRVHLDDGRYLSGPAVAAEPFAVPPPEFALTLDGQPHADPAALVTLLDLGPHTARLAVELADSVANLTLARAAQPEPDGGPPALLRYAGDGLADLEQCVVDGHPLHPLCRTRLGLSRAEVRAYAPEHRPLVQLPVYRVPERDWLSTGTGLPPRLLVHPWQAAHVLDRYPALEPTGETVPARPLMSLRTLALRDAPGWHVKTAVDVQMTSAVRTVSPAAVHNGPVVSALLADLGARAGIGVLREVAAGAVIVDGLPCRSLAMVWRQVPVPPEDAALLPLAALAAPSPATGRPLLTEAVTLGYQGRPVRFAAALVRLLLPPLLRLLHQGAALEAHGQNTLVLLRGGRPARIYYRDVGGVRLSPVRLGGAAPPLHGDLAADEPAVLRTKLMAALAVVLGELAATLTRWYGTDPAAVWDLVGRAARDTFAKLSGGYGDAEAVFGATLPLKATTAMRLAADPLTDLWTTLPNPLAGAA
jgi:siderophore synthetase component